MSKATMVFCFLFPAVFCMAQQQNDNADFPNSEEIQLAVSQSERVLGQYKQSITMEAELPTFKQNPDAIEKDLGVYRSAMQLLTALKTHPEGFHGAGGLLLLSLLDDASRNAALGSGTAYSDGMNEFISKADIHAAKDWLHVGLTCVDVSNYLYTVSESVQALLLRDMKAQQLLNERATETVNRCTAALKKCALQSK